MKNNYSKLQMLNVKNEKLFNVFIKIVFAVMRYMF